MKLPRQLSLSQKLDELLDLAKDLGRDHFSEDEYCLKIEKFNDLKKLFINQLSELLYG